MRAFVRYPDLRLTLKAVPAVVDDDLRAIGAALLAAQTHAQSYGLAAAHIGFNAPVIVLNCARSAPRNDVLFYNPVVQAVAEAKALGPEASVSLPGIEVQILRPQWADICYDDGDGVSHNVRFDGFLRAVPCTKSIKSMVCSS